MTLIISKIMVFEKQHRPTSKWTVFQKIIHYVRLFRRYMTIRRFTRWPVFHWFGRYFTATLAEAGKRLVFWKSVPEAGIFKINNLP